MRRFASSAAIALLVLIPIFPAAKSQSEEEVGAKPLAVTGPGEKEGQQLSNLMPLNFFSEGWNQPWEKRRRHTPDMALLKVTTNFLERELRLDYVLTEVAGNPKVHATDLANALIAYGLNRRFMMEVITNYQWNVAPSGPPTNGPGGALLARFQLVDTPGQSYSLQARVSAPNKGLSQTQTSLTYVLAGWQDVHEVVPALGRLGLYFSFQYENLVGPAKSGAFQNDVSYDVSLAETWTDPSTPVFGNLTTFLEAFAQTLLDGATSGRTTFSLTPGVRFWFVPENSLSFGVDLPASHAPPFSAIYRATYILNF